MPSTEEWVSSRRSSKNSKQPNKKSTIFWAPKKDNAVFNSRIIYTYQNPSQNQIISTNTTFYWSNQKIIIQLIFKIWTSKRDLSLLLKISPLSSITLYLRWRDGWFFWIKLVEFCQMELKGIFFGISSYLRSYSIDTSKIMRYLEKPWMVKSIVKHLFQEPQNPTNKSMLKFIFSWKRPNSWFLDN